MPEYKKNSSAHNIEEFQPSPEWLNSDYLMNAIRFYKNDDSIEILDVNIMPATGKGENYASVMLRVRVKYLSNKNDCEPQNGFYIVKTSFEDDEFAVEKFSEYNVFEREMEIYETIFPKMIKLLQAAFGNDHDDVKNLVPETIYIDYERNALIFEDLSVKNFVMAERKNGLDINHAKMVLRKLAKMHASSAVLNEIEPNIFKSYDRGMFNRHTEAFSPYFCNTLEVCGNLVKNWKGYEQYGEKLLRLVPVLMEYGKRAFDAKPDQLNVLIHGDIWINNVMFSYNERNQQPTDVTLIDFQFSCWSSPAVDIHYFFNTSLNEELRLNNQDELLQYYYYDLKNTLKALNFKGKIPTLHEFWVQYTEKSFYAFTSACIVQPIMINENNENADFHSLMGNDERARDFKKTVYSNEKVHKNLQRLLPIFDRRGLLDIS